MSLYRCGGAPRFFECDEPYASESDRVVYGFRDECMGGYVWCDFYIFFFGREKYLAYWWSGIGEVSKKNCGMKMETIIMSSGYS